MPPVLLGLAVAVLVTLVVPRFLDTSPALPEPWQRPYVFPFEADPAAGPDFFLLAPLGQDTAVAAMRADELEGQLRWASANIGVFHVAGNATPCGCAQSRPTVRIEAFVFNGAGQLLASNLDANQTARFPLSAHYSQLPGGNWSVGDAQWRSSVPADWRPVLDPLRLRLLDAPPGAVVSAEVARHPHAEALGPLYVTVRVASRAP